MSIFFFSGLRSGGITRDLQLKFKVNPLPQCGYSQIGPGQWEFCTLNYFSISPLFSAVLSSTLDSG